jgi:isoleucyl-tRNA synthetase
MDQVRTVSSVALGLRKTNGLRVRLPLSKLTVVTTGAAKLIDFAGIIAEELNVKEVELVELAVESTKAFGVEKQLTVNSRALGPRLGKQVQEIIQAEKLNWVTVGNRVIKALLQQTDEKIKQCRDHQISDACLLASIQQINHLKISWYGTAAEFARELGADKTASLFHYFEINEKKIDHLLSRLAKKEINPKAIAPIGIANG